MLTEILSRNSEPVNVGFSEKSWRVSSIVIKLPAFYSAPPTQLKVKNLAYA